MNEKLKMKLDALRALFPLSEEKVEDFDELLAEVAGSNDPAVIAPLLELVDDRCDLSGIMDSLLCSLEGFPPEPYVREFLRVFPRMVVHSPDAVAYELVSILWKDERRAALAANVASLGGPARRQLDEMLATIAARNASLRQRAHEVLGVAR
jgi:hypothetical protein